LALLRVVDLGTLQFAGVIDIHRLPRGEEVDSSIALAVAVAGVFDAAEGQMNLRAAVDAGFYRIGTAICAGVGASDTASARWPYNKP
jgi:hypothetical protein